MEQDCNHDIVTKYGVAECQNCGIEESQILNHNKMEKEFVPYELAVKLKALGFDERCLTYYENEVPKIYNDILGWDFNSSFFTVVSRPTLSQAFRWFREKYDLPSWSYESEGKWFWKIVKGDFWEQDLKLYIYEEAELACLTKLIEIVETRTK